MNYKTKIYLLLILFGASGSVGIYKSTDSDPVMYIDADTLPRLDYNGGFYGYIYDKMNWPKGFDGQGSVIVSFIVNNLGYVEQITIERELCTMCDKEVIRVLESMPKWIPGKKGDGKVDVKFYLPIDFKIEY